MWMRIVVGACLLVAAALIPPATVVDAVLPAEGAQYADSLVKGLWCLKAALLLNGLLLLCWRAVVHLWRAGEESLPRSQCAFTRFEPFGLPDYLGMAVVALVALVLRVVNLSQSLAADEVAIQQMFIDRGLPVIMTYMPSMPHHVLYSVLAYFAELLPLSLEVSCRLPAVLFGSGAVALFYVLCRRFFPRGESFLVSLLSALSLYGIVHSQMAKSYTVTQFGFLLALVSQLRIVDNPRGFAGWLGFGASLVLLVYGHLYNVYLAMGLCVGFCFVALWKLPWQPRIVLAWVKRLGIVLCVCGAALFLLYALQLPQILSLAREVQVQPEERMSQGFFEGWLMQMTFWGASWPIAVGCLAIVGLGLISLCILSPELAIIGCVPIVVLLSLVAVKDSFIYPRYLVFSVFIFLVCYAAAAVAVSRLVRKPWVGSLVLLLLFVLFVVPTGRALGEYYATGHQDLRGAVRFAEAGSDLPVFAYGLCHDELPFYGTRTEGVRSFSELKQRVRTRKSRICLVVAYPGILANKTAEQRFIRSNFLVAKCLPGMLMDSNRRDGDVCVYVSKSTNHQ